ncbi:MAG: PEP-CTERM sorting domain-containing protein [Acidobacteria bacterium]|nr:PEP-CTERM sorting domain-containing protein [Acidobacteriota bacterium]
MARGLHGIWASRLIEGLFGKEHQVARKTFIVAFFSICLMMAIPSGWADPGSASESPQNNTTVKGDAGYVEGFTGETIEVVLDRFFARTPMPVISQGNSFTKVNVAPPAGDISDLYSVSTDGSEPGQDLGPFAADSTPLPTPEPGTLMLLGSGILGLAVLGRRKLHK